MTGTEVTAHREAIFGTEMIDPLLEPGVIGELEIRNRFVRPGTSETMADERGHATPRLRGLYEELARNMVGLIVTGHLYCHSRGQYAPRQTGIHGDTLVAGLRDLVADVHRHDGRIFAQLAHAGSQSRVPGIQPVAPSPVPNALTGRIVSEATDEEIAEVVDSFRLGARRAVDAGFDGIHIHAANGYLISEFCSPLSNRREDRWGGSVERRDAFALAIARAVRGAVPPDFPVTLKLGVADAQPGGLRLSEALPRATRLVAAGVDALEISVNVMSSPSDSAAKYIAVDPRRAVEDLLVHRLASAPAHEAYFLPWAREVRAATDARLILVGGLRRVGTMAELVQSGETDFVALARPLIREPDLIRQIIEGRRGRVDCTSCNLCLTHEGHHSLRCWRTPRWRLLQHASYRFSGGLRRGILRTGD